MTSALCLCRFQQPQALRSFLLRYLSNVYDRLTASFTEEYLLIIFSRTYQHHVRNVSSPRSERIDTTFGTYRHHVRNVSQPRSERIDTTSGTYQDHVRNVLQPPQNLLEYVPNLLEPPHQRILTTSERIRTTSLTYSDHLGTYFDHLTNVFRPPRNVLEPPDQRIPTTSERIKGCLGTSFRYIEKRGGAPLLLGVRPSLAVSTASPRGGGSAACGGLLSR